MAGLAAAAALAGLLTGVFGVLGLLAGRPAAQGSGAGLAIVGVDTRGADDVRLSVAPPPSLGRLELPATAFSVRTSAGEVPSDVRAVPGAELDIALVVQLPERDDGRWLAVQSAAVEFALGVPSDSRLTVLAVADRVTVLDGPGTDRARAVAAIGGLRPGRSGPAPSLASVAVEAAALFDPASGRHEHMVVLSTLAPDPAGQAVEGSELLDEMVRRGGTVQLVRVAAVGEEAAPPPPPPAAPLDEAQVFDVARAGQLVGVLDEIVRRIANQYDLRFARPPGEARPVVQLRFRDVRAEVLATLPARSSAPVASPSAPPAPTSGGPMPAVSADALPSAPEAVAEAAANGGDGDEAATAAPAGLSDNGAAPSPRRAVFGRLIAAESSATDGVAHPLVLSAALVAACVGALAVAVLSGPPSSNPPGWPTGVLFGVLAGGGSAQLYDRGATLAASAVLAAFAALPVGLVAWRRGRRRRVVAHLPEALRLMAGPFDDRRGGAPARTARAGEEPRCRVCRTLGRAGVTPAALAGVRRLADRTGAAELGWLVDALGLRVEGSEPARVAQATAAIVDERVAHRRYLLALGADYRAAAVGLPLLPLAAAALVGLSSPSGLESFITRPPGWLLVSLAAGLSALAFRSLQASAAVPPAGPSARPERRRRALTIAVGTTLVSVGLLVVAVPIPPRFLPVVLAAGAGVALGLAVSSWMAVDGAPLTPEIDALDRTSLLASAGLSPRRALAGLERLDPAAAAVIGRSVEAAARRSGRGEVVLRLQASELRSREKAAAEARALRAPASIGTLAATCVLPAIVFLVAGPAAVG